MKRTGLIDIAGYFDSGTGKHQSNTVYRMNSILPALTTIDGGTQQIKILRKMKEIKQRRYGELVIMGGIGDNERVNRDSKRVLNGCGCMYALKAHIALEPPLTVKKVIKDAKDFRTYGNGRGTR